MASKTLPMYRNLSTIGSAVLWVLLPKCGLCLMAYAGIFSALGLGGLMRSGMALPLIIALMAINFSAVLYMSVVKKEYGYSLLCLCCALLFVINKLYLGSMTLNLVAGLLLMTGILRIRMFRWRSKDCVFKKAGDVRQVKG